MRYKCPKCGRNMKMNRSYSGVPGRAYNYRLCECGHSEYTAMTEYPITREEELYAAKQLVWRRKS